MGAALVTASAFGVVFAHRAAQSPPETRFLVLTSPVEAGEALEAHHLGSVAIDLPEAVDAVSTDRSQAVLGRVASHSLQPSELLSESALLDDGRFTVAGETEIAISVDPARTPVGQFATGDRVTVLSTSEAGTTELAAGARVTRIDGDEEDASIGASAQLRIGLALADIDEARAVVDAAVSEELTIVLSGPGTDEAP
ncbi:MAG: hypothetical protein M5U19_08215 [Microthrixaceae bacterium]|nr:hypothetical protein [Microthrixaceae bacterium]